METLVHTYGKTWHMWHTERGNELPLGVPQLMMGFTADGQLDPARVQERDKRFWISSEEKKQSRADIVAPTIDPEANGWLHGKTLQIRDLTGATHGTDSSHGTGP